MSEVPGITDTHCKITPTCLHRPDKEIVRETVDPAEDAVEELVDTYGPEDGVTIHVTVTVER